MKKEKEKGKREVAEGGLDDCGEKIFAGSLAGRMSSVPHEILRKCSTRREERFYGD